MRCGEREEEGERKKRRRNGEKMKARQAETGFMRKEEEKGKAGRREQHRAYGSWGGASVAWQRACNDVSGGSVSPEWMRSSWPPKHPTTGSSPASGEPKVCGAAPTDDVTQRRDRQVSVLFQTCCAPPRVVPVGRLGPTPLQRNLIIVVTAQSPSH